MATLTVRKLDTPEGALRTFQKRALIQVPEERCRVTGGGPVHPVLGQTVRAGVRHLTRRSTPTLEP